MKKLLLHVCCAPCMLGCLESVIDEFEVTAYYYNPNTFPQSEYYKRLEEVKKVLSEYYKNVNLIVADYHHEEFVKKSKGFETHTEGGIRCEKCMDLRITKTAEKAKELNFDAFDSTLSVSPHKNYNYILKYGENAEKDFGVEYLKRNFKKKDGFLKSVRLSKKYNVYRQQYCGCEFSINN